MPPGHRKENAIDKQHLEETEPSVDGLTVIGDVVELTLGGSPQAGPEDKRYAYS